MSGDQIVTLSIGIAGLLVSLILGIFSYILFNKREKIYLKKQEAIYSALEIIDRYLSWMRFTTADLGSVKPIRNREETIESLTLDTRKVYNDLISSCKNVNIINTFLDIILDEDKVLIKYKKFRDLCRKELGLKELNGLDENRIFLAQVSTYDLTQKK